MKKIKKILLVAGARPNFMKLAAIIHAFQRADDRIKNRFIRKIIHTGQHYHVKMSDIFFKELDIPRPDIYLGVGSGLHGEQTAKIIVEFEKVCLREKPALIIVVGDVNSTLAASIVAAKLEIPLAHVEAGLRSFDRSMPEEVNRLVTDTLSEFLFTTCLEANQNLIKEGIERKKIYFVGNVMVDTLLKFRDIAGKLESKKIKTEYALLTLHRPSNVDQADIFKGIIAALVKVSRKIPIFFPAHPRTLKQIRRFGFSNFFNHSNKLRAGKVNLIQPLSYLRFLNLMLRASFVLTDSGGIQEETTILKIPCLTIRRNTERPITITQGTNILTPEPDRIISESFKIIRGKAKVGQTPKYWDGKSAQRIVDILSKRL